MNKKANRTGIRDGASWRMGAMALAVLSSLTACRMGPDFKGADMQMPAEFRGAGASAESIADLAWWDVFRNGGLCSLLRDTYRNNKDLKSMMANVDSARQQVTIAIAPLFPWASYTGSIAKGANYSSGVPVQSEGVTTTPGKGYGNISWEIDLWGKTRRSVEAAEADYMATEYEQRALLLSLLKQVADGYLQLLQLDEELAIARESIVSYGKSLKLFTEQLEGGIGDRLQVASAEAALAASRAQVPALEAEIISLENTLSVLAGRAPGHIARAGSLNSVGAGRVPAGIPASILARRPDVLQKEQSLRAANANIGVAIADYFPSISLTGMGGFVSSDLTAATSKKSAWGVGADLTGPIFQGGRLRASERVARNNFLAAKSDYEKTVLTALSEVSTALIERARLQSVIEEQERAVKAYRESVELSMERYQGGLSSYYEVLTAQQNLFPAQTQLAQYKYQYAATLPGLYAALGGGWKNTYREITEGRSESDGR